MVTGSADQASGPPAVTVVVPTFNRARLLPRLVAALLAQDGAPTFEVVVVDDGSTDETPEVLGELVRTSGGRLQVRRREGGGPAAARNDGWRGSRGTLVVFTDDDCVPQPGWLAALAARAAGADLVQGRTVADPAQLHQRGWFGHTVEVDGERGFYETCNMAYRREVLEAVGGFDEAFRFPYGEDTDLAWRARGLGFGTAFEPTAVVHHDVRPASLLDRLRDLPRREGMVLVVKRHPQVRERFPNRWFFQPGHPRATAVLLAVAAAGARPRARWPRAAFVLALAAYAWPFARSMSVRDWTRVAPQWLVVDGAEVLVLARASLRHRTLLL